MVWPRAKFPKEWIIEEDSEDSSVSIVIVINMLMPVT
jgi:hypothetical protein